jgi:type III pantothenate kinase
VPENVLVASVAGPDVRRELDRWTAAQWGVAPVHAVVSERAGGLANPWYDPSRLGVDRWLAAVAAWQRHHGSACVIDYGTAVTIDAVSSQGEFLGGMIAPGAALMRRALGLHTGAAATCEIARPEMLAHDTYGAVAAGCHFALVGLVERAIAALRQRMGPGMAVVLTGGGAPMLQQELPEKFDVVPDLVLRGLAYSGA